MCGIAGAFHPSSTVSYLGKEDEVVARLRHRGPDAAGIWCSADYRAVLVHTRLSIIDVDSRSNQPFVRGPTITVFNGEIYNFRQLKQELISLGERFKTTGDTEVIAAGFERWGSDVFAKLCGMFAVAIYNEDENRLVLARDSFGIKPLYFADCDGEFRFGSEIKSLMLDDSPQINEATLWDLATFGYHFDHESIFRGVRHLPPGTVLEVSSGNGGLVCRRRTAKSLGSWHHAEPLDPETLADILAGSVRDHLIADVPVSAALSGGLDSSIVTALARTEIPQLTAYTNTFVHEKDDPEVQHARLLCDAKAIPSRIIRSVIPREEAFFDRVCWHLEEPIPNIALLTAYFLGRVLRKDGYKVVLIGEGSDELFAGYPWHALALRRKLSGSVRQLFDAYRRQRSQEALIDRWLTPRAKKQLRDRVEFQFERFRDCFTDASRSRLGSFLLFDQRYQLPFSQLLRVDRMFMSHSIEARVPFLYDSVAGFAGQLSDRELARRPAGKWRRWLASASFTDKISLRRAAKSLVPATISAREKFGKQGTVNLHSHTRGYVQACCRNTLTQPAFESARDAFSPYIDWTKLDRGLENSSSKERLFFGLLLGTMRQRLDGYRSIPKGVGGAKTVTKRLSETLVAG